MSVDVVNPKPSDTTRRTTQPATVHAYFEARVFAKASGYASEPKADIGRKVTKGQVLAVISIPEMAKQRDAKLATIERLKAEEQRVKAQLTIAQASETSYAA